MSDAQKNLEQLLAEANQRAEQEARRAEQEARRADQAEQIVEKLKQETRPTTLQEYLQACQMLVLSRVILDTKGYLTTKVPSTKPTNKHCPRLIQPWNDFVATQQRINTCVDHIVPRDARLYESVHFLEAIGERIHNRPVRGEAALRYIQNNAVEDPVRIIVNKLKDLHPERQGLALFGGVHFQTTASNLRDKTDGNDTTERDEKLMTDQICVLRSGQEKSTAYVIEYKAPHRLHTIHLDKGLRPMSILDEVVNKPTIPTLESEKQQHYAELLTAAAITQTYHYMLEAGLEYGCLANGDAMVFLKIDWADPTVLLYHLAQPLREVEIDKDPIYSNAVCQLLAFTILALQSQQHGNDERVAATARCSKWMVDFNCMIEQIATMEESQTPSGRKHRRVPSSPEWLPSPVKRRRRSPEQHATSDRVLRSHDRHDDPGGGSGGGSSGDGRPGPSDGSDRDGYPSQSGHSGSASGPATTLGGASGAQSQSRPYCTPLCLLTLISGRLMDNKCPNAVLHSNEQQTKAGKKASSLQRHPVSHAQWMTLLQEQLSKSLEKGVVPLGQEGACGALFQITLLQYGYTFVAKGVTGRAVPQLKHEEAVYQKLQPLQGRHIPVCLGSVDLRPLNQVYYYDFDVRLIYLLLMSYGGAPFRERPDADTEERLKGLLKSVVREMHDLGVVHGDIRLPNVLQSPTGHFTVIDFDQALLLPATDDRDALDEIASNQRKRLPEVEAGEENKASRAKQIVTARLGKDADHGNAASIFTIDGGRVLEWSSK